jgi:hypothetical protein
MFTSIRRIACSAALLLVFSSLAPAAARADDPPNLQDYNTYWQVAQDPNSPNPNQDYNAYWAQVQAQQQSGPQQ